jgi:hypothetical protein
LLPGIEYISFSEEVMVMGWISRMCGSEVRESHQDGSYTDRNEKTGTSYTYGKDGELREYAMTWVPLIGPTHVDTYNSDGDVVNTQYPKNDG